MLIMKGLLLKYDGDQTKLSEMLRFLDSNEYNFYIAFDDLASNEKDEFWNVESYTSDMAKKMIFHPSSKRYIIALDLFVSERKNYYADVETYSDFLNSDYFFSLHILDCSKVAIFCKNESILVKIKAIYMQFSLDNIFVKEIETVPSNIEMASYSSNSSTCLWTI